MASYAQIAQKTFSIDREDGTTRKWRFTFDKKDGTAQTYEVPIIEDIEIIEGDRSDAPNKPFKIHQASFKVKGVDEPLIEEIAAAGLRDIRVTIEDTATSTIKFAGYVLKELTTYRLYDDVQEVSVNCYGGLADLDSISMLFDSSLFGLNITLDQLANDIGTLLDLDRELDIYTSLHHEGLTTSDPFPTDISYNEEPIAGGGDDATMLDVVKNVMSALGFQLFQRNGRLIMADLYDRFANSSAINKHESDGLGGYTNTSENIEVTLSESNVIKGGEFKDLAPVIALQQRYSLTDRDATAFTDPSPTFESRGDESEHNMDFGLALEGDVISATIQGDIVTSGPAADVAGNVEFARFELQDYLSGTTLYFSPSSNTWVEASTGWSQSFSFTGGGGIQEQPFFVNTELPPVPEGVLAKIVLVTSCDVTVTTGSATDVTQTDYDDLNVSAEFADPDAAVTHIFEASSSGEVGDTIQGNTFLGDEDLHTDDHAFHYNNAGIPTDTFNWISATGNGRLGAVAAERVGAVVVGEGQSFTVLIRDTTDVDLLSVIKITDNDGVIRTCFPTEIRHRLSSGYYRVRVRECFNGVVTTSDTYGTGAISEAGTGVGSGVAIGGGAGGGLSVTDANALYLQEAKNLDDLDDPETAQANLGLHDATADLDLSSISVEGVNLFPSLDPQPLGISDAPSFAGLTSGDISVTNTINIDAPAGSRSQLFFQKIGTSKWHVEYDDISGDSLRWVESGVAVRHHFHAGGNVQLGGALMVNASSLVGTETLRVAGAALIEGDVTATGTLTGVDANFSDDVAISGALTVSLDATFNDDVSVLGTADIAIAQIQTLQTTLFKPTTVSGMGGEIAFSAVSEVVSIDTVANTIVVEDAVFSNGDAVIVSSAAYNQTGFSNVELNITSAGTTVAGGTEYSYTVNSGDETDIGKGDSATRVSGDLIYINATEGANSPRIAGYDNLTGFADSPFSGATADPVWELTPTGGVIGGATITPTLFQSANNDGTLRGGGILLDWGNEEQSIGDNISFSSSNITFPDEVVKTTDTDTTDIDLTAGTVDPAGWTTTVQDITIEDGDVLRFWLEFDVDSGQEYTIKVFLQYHDGASWNDADESLFDPVVGMVGSSFSSFPSGGSWEKTSSSPLTLQRGPTTSATAPTTFGRLVLYTYPNTITHTRFRVRIRFEPNGGSGGSWSNSALLVNNQSKTYAPSVEMNKGGVWFRDADVLISRVASGTIKDLNDANERVF